MDPVKRSPGHRPLLVTLAAVVGMALITGCNQDEGSVGGDAQGTAVLTTVETAKASLTVRWLGQDLLGFCGHGGPGDGTQLVVADGSDTIIGASQFAADPPGQRCNYTATAPDIPMDSDFYVLRIGNTTVETVSRVDAEQRGWTFEYGVGSGQTG